MMNSEPKVTKGSEHVNKFQKKKEDGSPGGPKRCSCKICGSQIFCMPGGGKAAALLGMLKNHRELVKEVGKEDGSGGMHMQLVSKVNWCCLGEDKSKRFEEWPQM